MGTINPRAGREPSLRGRLRSAQDDRQQIRRLLSAPPKVPAAAAGGVTGVTRLTAGSLVQSNDVSPVGSSATFSDYSGAALFGDAVTVTEGADGRVTFGTAGFYMATAYVRLAFDGSAAVDEVRASADFEGSDPYPLWYRRLGTEDGHGGGPSLRDSFSWGPFYVDAGGWTFFGLNWQTSDHAYLSAMALDVWRVG